MFENDLFVIIKDVDKASAYDHLLLCTKEHIESVDDFNLDNLDLL